MAPAAAAAARPWAAATARWCTRCRGRRAGGAAGPAMMMQGRRDGQMPIILHARARARVEAFVCWSFQAHLWRVHRRGATARITAVGHLWAGVAAGGCEHFRIWESAAVRQRLPCRKGRLPSVPPPWAEWRRRTPTAREVELHTRRRRAVRRCRWRERGARGRRSDCRPEAMRTTRRERRRRNRLS